MADELEKLLGEDKKDVTPPLEDKKPEEKPKVPDSPEENPEVKKANEHLANIRAAVKTEEEKLKKIRDDQRKAKNGVVEEEELPQIDDKDPSAKAWTKRIRESISPTADALEKAKDERRLFTLRRFLEDKPDLAKNPEKVKAMMETYDRIKTSTELTNEGIEMDLEKAYAAEFHEELISAARQARVTSARKDMIYSDPAVSRGSTAYSSKDESKPREFSDEERAILAKWGSSPGEQARIEEEQRKKASVG